MSANTAALTYSDLLRPVSRRNALLYDFALVFGGSILIALSAKLSFYLPFSPVPITGHSFAVFFIGMLFGGYRGALTVLTYIMAGAGGLPVFAGAGAGIVYLAGPTGGYILGFVAAAYITGVLAERGWDRHFLTAGLAMIIGNIFVFIPGLSWLALYSGWGESLSLGLYPFIAGDIVKIFLAAILLPSGWKILNATGYARRI